MGFPLVSISKLWPIHVKQKCHFKAHETRKTNFMINQHMKTEIWILPESCYKNTSKCIWVWMIYRLCVEQCCFIYFIYGTFQILDSGGIAMFTYASIMFVYRINCGCCMFCPCQYTSEILHLISNSFFFTITSGLISMSMNLLTILSWFCMIFMVTLPQWYWSWQQPTQMHSSCYSAKN